MQYIELKREEYKGKDSKKRKEFQKYADIIEFLDFGLAEKFDYCNTQYAEVIDEYKRAVLRRYNFTQEQLDDLSFQFAKKRNLLIHSSVEEFDEIHVLAYSLARTFIYAMILDKANIDPSMITQAIDKVL